MNPCRECSTNSWTFEKKDGWITATCRSCKAEVKFQAREGNPSSLIGHKGLSQPEVIHTLGEQCPKCGKGELKEGTHKPGWVPKEGQRYFFNKWLYCPACRESFFLERDKVEVAIWSKEQEKKFEETTREEPPRDTEEPPF
jgi:transcription elongation factor Elf1